MHIVLVVKGLTPFLGWCPHRTTHEKPNLLHTDPPAIFQSRLLTL